MSRIPYQKMVCLTDNISALYQLGVISSAEKNELAACLQQGQDGLETLYLKTLSLGASEHDITCKIREIIILGK